jgi:hypothetical protein
MLYDFSEFIITLRFLYFSAVPIYRVKNICKIVKMKLVRQHDFAQNEMTVPEDAEAGLCVCPI